MKCIVTGLGNRGLHWIGKVKARTDCEVVACVEPMEANRERAVEKHGIAKEIIFPTLGEAITNSEADFILDVTPPAVHHQVAEEAFTHELHVLGEKPLSDDYATAKRIAELGELRGYRHMITQNYRFTSQPRTTRPLLESGLIGAPGQCDVRFYMPWADLPGSHYVTEPFMLINDMMVHHFDLLRYVLGREPVSVQAITWKQPWGWLQGDSAQAIVFHYGDDLTATHVAGGCAMGSRSHWNGDWRIEGPQGSIDWDKDGVWHSHLYRTDAPVDRRRIEELAVPEPETAILDEFFAAIREDREPECSAQDNLKSVAMVFAAIKSAQEKRPVELAELDA